MGSLLVRVEIQYPDRDDVEIKYMHLHELQQSMESESRVGTRWSVSGVRGVKWGTTELTAVRGGRAASRRIGTDPLGCVKWLFGREDRETLDVIQRHIREDATEMRRERHGEAFVVACIWVHSLEALARATAGRIRRLLWWIALFKIGS